MSEISTAEYRRRNSHRQNTVIQPLLTGLQSMAFHIVFCCVRYKCALYALTIMEYMFLKTFFIIETQICTK